MEKIEQKITKKNVVEYIQTAIENKDYATALDLVRRFKRSGFTVVLTTLKEEYRLSTEQIKQLIFLEVKNPHYATAAPMKLYLKAQINHLFNL